MPKPNLPLKGHCRCGKVEFEISAPPLVTMACHCTGCQRMSSSAYSLSAAIPMQGFRVTKGEPVVAGAAPAIGHHFCPDCMTWMFTRMPGMDFFVNVRPTLCEDTSWYSPFVETYTSEKLAWAETPAAHAYEKFPPFEDFDRLMKEYASL